MEAPLHILVVDDRDDIRELLTAFLEGSGFRVSTAGGVEEARAALRAGGLSLVLLDLVLPGETGFDLVDEVAASSLPLILMSGDFESLERARKLPLPLLKKPFR